MLLIIEGPDGCGKTTLIEQLVATLESEQPGEKIEVLKKGPPKSHPLDEYEAPLYTYRPGREHHIICDRWHVGEWVYPSVLGRRTVADKAAWYHIEMFLASRGALVIYPEYTVNTLVQRVLKRGDDLIEPHQLAKIAAGYAYMSSQHLAVTTRVNGKSPSALVALARHRESVTERLSGLTTYVGPPRPEWLLVGDVRNATYDGDPRPAFMPYRGTSGHYLLSALSPRQLHSGVGVMNACDVDDALSAQYLTFHDVSVVTLGNHAHGKMNGAGVHHPGAPHPQYVRRFHNKHGAAYAHAIHLARGGEEMIAWRPNV